MLYDEKRKAKKIWWPEEGKSDSGEGNKENIRAGYAEEEFRRNVINPGKGRSESCRKISPIHAHYHER